MTRTAAAARKRRPRDGRQATPKIASVASSSIGAAGYDDEARVLRIRFAGGGTYDYLGVPPALYAAFNAADSKGRFVNHVIKPSFPYRRVA